MEKEINVQVKDNSPSIERILRPISYTSWLLGVGVAHPRKCPKAVTIIIRIIHMTVCSISVIYDTIEFLPNIYHTSQLDIVDYIYCLNKVMCYVSTYYYVYHGIRQYDKWLELMDKLKELDQKNQEGNIHELPVYKIIEVLAVFTTFTSCPLMLIFHVLHDYLSNATIFIPDLMLYYMLSQSLISSFVFDVIVYVLYCRFQTINKLIDQLDKLSNVSHITFKIRDIRIFHTDIYDLVNMVKDIYGLHLLFCPANCFTMVVDIVLEIYYLKGEKNYYFILMQTFFGIVYVMQFFLICWICTLANQESNRTGRIIYGIILNYKPANHDNHEARNKSSLEMQPPLEDLDGEQSFNRNSHNLNYDIVENPLCRNMDRECITKEINDFSIQLQQNRIAFTACDFFEINNALFGSFVGVTISYLVIVGQLYQQPKDLSMLKKVIMKMTRKNQTYSHN